MSLGNLCGRVTTEITKFSMLYEKETNFAISDYISTKSSQLIIKNVKLFHIYWTVIFG